MFPALMKTFFVLVIGTLSGYFLQKISDKKPQFSFNKRKLSILLQKIAMLGIVSITYIGSLWIFNIENLSKIISMPFVGALSTIVGGVFALMVARYRQYRDLDKGSMFCCGYFSNTVTLGGMICFFYLGEEGYALIPIFTFFVRILYYGLGYPIAHMYSESFVKQKEITQRIIQVIKDPFFYVGLGSIMVGVLLNISSWQRPEVYGIVNAILIPINTFILLFSIGLSLKLRSVFCYIKSCLYITIIKFIAVPLSILLIAIMLDIFGTLFAFKLAQPTVSDF